MVDTWFSLFSPPSLFLSLSDNKQKIGMTTQRSLFIFKAMGKFCILYVKDTLNAVRLKA